MKNVVSFCLGLIAVSALFVISEFRHEPKTPVERVIGYFLTPGELVTGDSDTYWRMISMLEGTDLVSQESLTKAAISEDRALARGLDIDTLERLVERYSLPPENPFAQELAERLERGAG